jgi:copper chaperone
MLRLKVEGITCGGCVASIQRALGAAAPGAKVSVDAAKGEVEVAGAAAKAVVVAAIEDAGFTVTGEAA